MRESDRYDYDHNQLRDVDSFAEDLLFSSPNRIYFYMNTLKLMAIFSCHLRLPDFGDILEPKVSETINEKVDPK